MSDNKSLEPLLNDELSVANGTSRDIRNQPQVHPSADQKTITSADAQSATQVWAKTASQKIYILTLIVSTDTAMNIQFQDDAGTPAVLVEQLYLAANGGAVMRFDPASPLTVAENQDLDVIASAAGNISVTAVGYQV